MIYWYLVKPFSKKLVASSHALPNTAHGLVSPSTLTNPPSVSVRTPILPSLLPFSISSPTTPNPQLIFILVSLFSLAFLNVMLSWAFLIKFKKRLMAGKQKLSLKLLGLSSSNQWLLQSHPMPWVLSCFNQASATNWINLSRIFGGVFLLPKLETCASNLRTLFASLKLLVALVSEKWRK